MWTVLIVPVAKELQFFEEVIPVGRHKHNTCIFLLERQDKPLDDCNAAMLSNGPESRADFLRSAPLFEIVVPELRAFITDYVFRTLASPGNALSEEMTHLQRGGLVLPN